MYHDPHGEDAGSSKENRMIFTESMPRRVGSFYRGKKQEPPNHKMCVVYMHLKYMFKVLRPLNITSLLYMGDSPSDIKS